MRTMTLELACTDGADRTMTLYADGTYNIRYAGDLHSEDLYCWHSEMRRSYLRTTRVAHLVPIIDAAFAALKEGTTCEP